ncbi:hypothetical protein A2165_01070, partial [Candidatus Curtissbacteria bacterium RBG_13_40_7]
MKTKNIEIEIKVKVQNIKSLLGFLNKKGKFINQVHQVDDYLVPSHRNFLELRPVKEWFRLRNEDGVYTLNYKNYHFDRQGKSHHCDEFETGIENPDQAKRILKALNFKRVVRIEKTRKIWIYKDYETAVDSVKNMGDFVEIEYKGKSKNVKPRDITAQMITFLKDLGCGKLERS